MYVDDSGDEHLDLLCGLVVPIAVWSETLRMWLEDLLAGVDGHAILIVDGDEHHPAYYGTHRELKLADRRIIEDPWMQGSHVSQLIQAADLVAYSAFQHLARRPDRDVLWNWYEQHIKPLVVPPGLVDGVFWLPPGR